GDDPHDCVGRRENHRVGDLLDADVTGGVDDGGEHVFRLRAARYLVTDARDGRRRWRRGEAQKWASLSAPARALLPEATHRQPIPTIGDRDVHGVPVADLTREQRLREL